MAKIRIAPRFYFFIILVAAIIFGIIYVFVKPEKEAMIDVSLYMYDAYSGELIWAVFESVEKHSDFPMFTNDFELMNSAEYTVAKRLISHLVFPPPPDDWEHCGGCGGCK